VEVLFTLREVAEATGGEILGGGNPIIGGVSVDSRLVLRGDLFVALPGERVDGHQFLPQARDRGAVAALVSRRDLTTDLPLVLVEDTTRALGDLAAWYRSRFPVTVVGVTGSVGKTTTKDMIAGVLGVHFSVLKTEGNYNTEIGLPLTLFRLRAGHSMAVLEMAMRGMGQIARLAEIARPRIGVITTVTESHLELLGSMENILKAKAELVEALPADGVAVLSYDNPALRGLGARLRAEGKQVVFFGFSADCPVRAADVRILGADGTEFTLYIDGEGRRQAKIPLAGRHQVHNALAAAAVGHLCELELEDIVEGLRRFDTTGMRMEVIEGKGITLVNDAYNASPTSTKAALKTVAAMHSSRTIVVLGPMLELGAEAVERHREVGRLCAELDVDYLFTVGGLALGIAEGALAAGLPADRIASFQDNWSCLETVAGLIQTGDVVLIKGSRAAKMEEIVEGLKGRILDDE